ncbi:Hypothetical protein Bdt_0358 [Bdellovibrio bacteriovorus str. Tiberius]|uniref:Uncharacterized protein n=1 Tax=Bdellovibrio bacteriovorus str. Tiberius TaxID=1069642 RepID=K7YK44_BDEBC|nr:Hypothetical protein Bdt_0358 [Bdellovibrio bacteriovorus str. Tiberius]
MQPGSRRVREHIQGIIFRLGAGCLSLKRFRVHPSFLPLCFVLGEVQTHKNILQNSKKNTTTIINEKPQTIQRIRPP